MKTERKTMMHFDEELARFSFAIQLPIIRAKINLSCRVPVSLSTESNRFGATLNLDQGNDKARHHFPCSTDDSRIIQRYLTSDTMHSWFPIN